MLYIFHVDTGTMMTFDMNLAMDSVSNLQRVIAKACHIQEDKQVLLISGGESLDPSSMVGSYSAGTDTNPIFLFSKSTIEAATPPSPSVHYGSDIDLQEQVEGSLIMPPTYETVVSRAQLALQFHEVDKEELRACEKLVHDQHLQQQGWAAVVANLEDITSALNHRSEIFQDAYTEYLAVREHFISLLAQIPDVLSLLSKIPVLRCLRSITEQAVPEETDTGDEVIPQTLYAWINSQDPQNRLEDLSTQCLRVTEQFDDKILEMLRGEVTQTFEAVSNQNMKEVKGLEDRLYGLDQIMSGAKRLVQEQSEMAQGFVQNQNRAGNLRDNSVLPDLCASHKKQLLVMLNNHRKLREIKKKCRMAKEELSINLHTRLRWVMFVEKKLCDVDGKLMIYHENLKRLRKRLDILQQIHDGPSVYAQLVVEVVRRKNFSSNFLQWAANLAEESSLIHADEVKRREVFLMEVGQHFLHALFHGFEDIPPKFAAEAPELFDQRLPNITSDDLVGLQKAVPELSEKFSLSKEVSGDLEQRLSALGPKAGPSLASLAESISPGRAGSKSRQLTPLCQSHNTCTSDIDILQESNGHFSPIECEEISFDGHICAPGTEPVIKPGPISPQENLAFLMPESLSTKLTAEMKSQGSLETTVNLSLVDSGDAPAKELVDSLPKSSDESSSSRKIIVSGAVTSDTSPEGEISQDFTTADFYIDESMPSSIEHMTASKSLEKSELSKQLQEKCDDVVKLEQEIRDSQERLTFKETKLKTLQDFVEAEMENLRTDLVTIKEDYSKNRTVFLDDMVSFSRNLTDVLKTYEMNMTMSHNDELKKLQASFDGNTSDLEDKLSSALEKVERLQTEIKETKEQWDNTKAESEATRISLQTKINELSEAYENEREEMIRQHTLEMEVELDKVRDELQQEINKNEVDLKEKVDEITKLHDQLSDALLDKEKLFEDLTQKFQSEKDELVSTLEKDFAERKEAALTEALEDKAQLHEDAMLNLKREFDEKVEEVEQKVSKLKQDEYEVAINKLKEEHQLQKETEIAETKKELQQDHSESLKKLEDDLKAQHQTNITKKVTEFTKEKDDLKAEIVRLEKLRDEFLQQKESEVQEIKQQHSENWKKAEQTLKDQHLKEMKEKLSEIHGEKDQLKQEIERLEKLKEDVFLQKESEIQDMKNALQQEHSENLKRIEENLDAKHHKEMEEKLSVIVEKESLKEEIVKLKKATGESVPGNAGETVSREKHEQIITDIQTQFELTKTLAIQEAVKDFEANKETELSALKAKMEQESLDKLTALTAEKQVLFNEAVTKLTAEKEKLIEELRAREASLLSQQQKDKELLDKLISEKTLAQAEQQETQEKLQFMRTRQHRLDDELAMSRQQMENYREQLQTMSTMSVVSTASEISGVPLDESMMKSNRLLELEGALKTKEEEISKLNQKVMELSMTASTRNLTQDKVSITSCSIGDTVLLCLDERHDQYVVFTVGTTLHFLHSECLAPLGLKTNPGEPRKSWVLAQILEKEYCQAKKAQNRFRVPIGTKFYRVKAKPWSRESPRRPALGDGAVGGAP